MAHARRIHAPRLLAWVLAWKRRTPIALAMLVSLPLLVHTLIASYGRRLAEHDLPILRAKVEAIRGQPVPDAENGCMSCCKSCPDPVYWEDISDYPEPNSPRFDWQDPELVALNGPIAVYLKANAPLLAFAQTHASLPHHYLQPPEGGFRNDERRRRAIEIVDNRFLWHAQLDDWKAVDQDFNLALALADWQHTIPGQIGFAYACANETMALDSMQLTAWRWRSTCSTEQLEHWYHDVLARPDVDGLAQRADADGALLERYSLVDAIAHSPRPVVLDAGSLLYPFGQVVWNRYALSLPAPYSLFEPKEPEHADLDPGRAVVRLNLTRLQARRHLTCALLQLQIYRAQHHSWPKTLAELPEYTNWGDDPTSPPPDDKLHYLQMPDGSVRVYANGRNGVDDGGHGDGPAGEDTVCVLDPHLPAPIASTVQPSLTASLAAQKAAAGAEKVKEDATGYAVFGASLSGPTTPKYKLKPYPKESP